MKRIITILLVVCLICCISITAAATEHIEQAGSKEIEVTAKYASSTSTPIVYSVDIDWSSMTFTYMQRNTNKWNAANHSYATISEGSWDKNSATVTVTNHSNVAVNVMMKYTAVGNTGVKGTLTNDTSVLAAGKVDDYNGADAVTATLTISGTPSSAIGSDGVKVGSIKVTIK